MPLMPTIAAYFVTAAVLGLAGARLGKVIRVVAIVPFAWQLAFVAVAALETERRDSTESFAWIPSLGVSVSFRIDALTLVLTTVVAAVGFLIVVYSGRYMTDPGRRSRFLALMVLFSGGMAGLVVSDDLFGLFVFWEVTTVASYLLIGFDDNRPPARAAALQAILVTAAGGLAMLAGFVLVAAATGSSSITAIAASPPSGTAVTAALVLIMLGAFTKSAQFPFHFWLPGAMTAPTPASAYLHSATMVNAGIVLLILLAPAFGNEALWIGTVTAVGLVTMVVGATQAMRQRDLKLLLAHSTVSQLGFMTALIGLGITGVALAVLVGHAAFKASLFLVVGVIDKDMGTRDITRLSGLGRSRPGLAVVAGAAAMSMAGVPPLLGFVTKEAAFDALIADGAWVTLTVAALASVLTVAYTARFFFGAFGAFGSGDDSAVAPERPSPAGLILPAAALAAASLALGIVPGGLESAVGEATNQATALVLWPGWKPALAISAFVIAAGASLHLMVAQTEVRERRLTLTRTLGLPTAHGVYQAAIRGLNRVADFVTGLVQNGSLPVYVAVIITTVVVVPGAVWFTSVDPSPTWSAANGAPEIVLAAVAIAAGLAATRAQRRMAAALLLGGVGFAVSGLYLTFGAPDLALTQLLIETFTIALFAFVLARLPRRFGIGPRSLSRPVRIAVAALAGAFVTGAALLAGSVSPDRGVAEFYVANAPTAEGRNVVNVILTDFRALDTLGEITVLAAAGIGVAALVRAGRRKTTDSEDSENPPTDARVEVGV
jgi:multicomponent Na+:H+ antiporter subunit A